MQTETPPRTYTLSTSPTIAETLSRYEVYLATARKLRPRAVATYLRDLRQFVAWLGEEAQVADVTAAQIEAFQATKRDARGATVAKLLTTIRSYCRWCIRTGLRADDPTLDLEWPRRDDPLPRALSAAELARLEEILAAPLDEHSRKVRRVRERDRRAVLLMLYAGLRLSEVCNLRWGDVDLDAGVLVVTDGKGGKQRTVTLHARLVDELSAVPLCDRRRTWAVCGHKSGQPLSYKSLPHIFDRWMASEGLHISAHRCRHAFAVTLLRNGANLRAIQGLLGHASLATTERYLALELEDKRRAIAKLPDRFG